ncbi:MAG: universal stress protein [Steroidobacteraceae bacterium]|nr:universal stress protein [Nevskiaceae bacterium]MCP5339512.1 universal stress protein [Nevskiaceae bacterium]MCP5359197.1 universal stress protein [Nevskiaceae bacterium]MCP5466430.1 universal stress protein [Nevskiaceae bacterium]MCP5471868.1 universal stress protein [Nevskiaceae bacterium]
MPPLKSILVLADRSAGAQGALQKAFVIARHFGAGIELAACDAEQAWMARVSDRADENAPARAVRRAESRRFLEALRSTVLADDLQIRVGEDCDGPLYEALPRRVQAAGCHLIVKRMLRREGRHRPTLTSADWQLIRSSPVPVMLTHGRPWRPRPRFVAYVDDPTAAAMVDTARFLAEGCDGIFEVVCGAVAGAAASVSGEGGACNLAARPAAAGGAAAATTMPADQSIDVVVLCTGGQSSGEDELRAELTDRLVDQLNCDVLLIPWTVLQN